MCQGPGRRSPSQPRQLTEPARSLVSTVHCPEATPRVARPVAADRGSEGVTGQPGAGLPRSRCAASGYFAANRSSRLSAPEVFTKGSQRGKMPRPRPDIAAHVPVQGAGTTPRRMARPRMLRASRPSVPMTATASATRRSRVSVRRGPAPLSGVLNHSCCRPAAADRERWQQEEAASARVSLNVRQKKARVLGMTGTKGTSVPALPCHR